jgi:hypothetical protein
VGELTAGWTFVSNERRPMLVFADDTSRAATIAWAACDAFRNVEILR